MPKKRTLKLWVSTKPMNGQCRARCFTAWHFAQRPFVCTWHRRLDDHTVGLIPNKIMDRIHVNCSRSCLLMVLIGMGVGLCLLLILKVFLFFLSFFGTLSYMPDR
jgi:hypothetical protein